MKITLTPAQEATLLAWARERTSLEVNAGVEPSGYRLEIEVGPFPNARARWGTDELDLGDVAVELSTATR